jgi:hypothetical protein
VACRGEFFSMSCGAGLPACSRASAHKR